MGAVRRATDNAIDNCLVVAQHAHSEHGPLVAPHLIKPLSIQRCTESDGSGAVGDEIQVWSWGPVGEDEKASAGPGHCEGPPPMDVQMKAFVEYDHIAEAGDGGAAVDYPSQEGAAGRDDLCCKAKGGHK